MPVPPWEWREAAGTTLDVAVTDRPALLYTVLHRRDASDIHDAFLRGIEALVASTDSFREALGGDQTPPAAGG